MNLRNFESNRAESWARNAVVAALLTAAGTYSSEAEAAPTKLECTEAHPDLCNVPACHELGKNKFPEDATLRDNWIAAHCEGEEKPECSDGVDNKDPEDKLADINDPGCHTDGNPNNPGSYDPNDNSERDPKKPLTAEEKAARERFALEKEADRQRAVNKLICEQDPTDPSCPQVEGPKEAAPRAAKVSVVNEGLTEAQVEAATKKALDSRNKCAFALGFDFGAAAVLNLGGNKPGAMVDYALDLGARCQNFGAGVYFGGAHLFGGYDSDLVFGPRGAKNIYAQVGAWGEGYISPIKKAKWFKLIPGARVGALIGAPSDNPAVAQDSGPAAGGVLKSYLDFGFNLVDAKDDEGDQKFGLDLRFGPRIGGVVTNFENGTRDLAGDPDRDDKANFGGAVLGGNAAVEIRF